MQLKCKFGTNGPLSLFEDNDEPLSFVGYSFYRSYFDGDSSHSSNEYESDFYGVAGN